LYSKIDLDYEELLHNNLPYITEMFLARDIYKLSQSSLKDNNDNEKFLNILSSRTNELDSSFIEEFTKLDGGKATNAFRRNIALRLNRVLNPARNAQIFTHLYSTLISDGYWEDLVQMSSYVGFSPHCYYKNQKICFNEISKYVLEEMLELDLTLLKWISAGKIGLKPRSRKENNECPQEWFYTQISRPDTNYRIQDMLMSILRLALRYGAHDIKKKMSEGKQSYENNTLKINLQLTDELLMSGLGLDNQFIQRIKDMIVLDVQYILNNDIENAPLIEIE
jgi:hypothetical protein